MHKAIPLFIIIGIVGGGWALEPSHIKNTVYYDIDANEDGIVDENDVLTSIDYSDGLEIGIQTQVYLDGNNALVSGIYYDGAGRDSISALITRS